MGLLGGREEERLRQSLQHDANVIPALGKIQTLSAGKGFGGGCFQMSTRQHRTAGYATAGMLTFLVVMVNLLWT